MKKNNHGLYSLSVVFALFIANMFALFFLSPSTEGNLTSWILAIVTGVISIFALMMLAMKLQRNGEINKALTLLIIIALNVMMIVFSILDIADVKNYTLSTITFVVVPVASIFAIGLTTSLK